MQAPSAMSEAFLLSDAIAIPFRLGKQRRFRPALSSDSSRPPAPSAMTSQGRRTGRYTRAIQRRNLFQAELALREMRDPSLLVLVDYLELLADVRPDKFDRAAVRWHGRLELESALLTIAESELALAALGALRAGDKDAAEILRRLLRRVQPTLVRSIG